MLFIWAMVLFLTSGVQYLWSESVEEVTGIDHIVLGVSDLDAGIRQFEDLTGVKLVFGGRHPNRGTQNALVSLGDRLYIEIISPVPGAHQDEFIVLLSKLNKVTPILWAVSTTDADSTAKRLNESGFETTLPEPGSRLRPDGVKLEWRTFGVQAPAMDLAPFFIQWSANSPHPSKDSPGRCTLSSLELTDSHADALEKLVKLLALPVGLKSGTNAVMKVSLNCPKGKILIGD